jgi:hypothetical protein
MYERPRRSLPSHGRRRALYAPELSTPVLSRAISRLETALRRQGIQWSYWRDLRLRLRFHSDPSAIHSETDTAEIRTMKDDVVERRKAIFASLPKLIRIAVIGLGLTAVAGLVELALKKE